VFPDTEPYSSFVSLFYFVHGSAPLNGEGKGSKSHLIGRVPTKNSEKMPDRKTGHLVCVKIIRNNKDFFDQGLDEIKLLH